MKQCPKCQTVCPEDSKFCPTCGAEAVEISNGGKAVTVAGQVRFCSNCGAECTADTAFCPKCGAPMNAPAAAPVAESEPSEGMRPPEVNEWYFAYGRKHHNTRIMSQGSVLSVEQWKQVFTFGGKYGRKNFRLDVKDINAVILKKSLSVGRVIGLIAGALLLLFGIYIGEWISILIGLLVTGLNYKGLHDKYIYVQFPNGYFKIQDSFAVGSDVESFLQYVNYYNPKCVRTFMG